MSDLHSLHRLTVHERLLRPVGDAKIDGSTGKARSRDRTPGNDGNTSCDCSRTYFHFKRVVGTVGFGEPQMRLKGPKRLALQSIRSDETYRDG
jgi:hypothetical protein